MPGMQEPCMKEIRYHELSGVFQLPRNARLFITFGSYFSKKIEIPFQC